MGYTSEHVGVISMAMICDNCVVGHLYSRVLALSLERQWQCWLSAASGLILS